MLHRKKRKGLGLWTNKKGFSLVEVLIAIGILAIVVVPLAINMITSSRFNAKAKQTASSSDLATSILDTMQTIDLGAILADVNGYSTDEYGVTIPYTLTGNTLSNYHISKKTEVTIDGNKYVPVVKQGSTKVDENGETVLVPESDVTSSIIAKSAGNVIKTYFTGKGRDNYAFVLTGVENDKINVDVLVTIEPKQTFSMVDINSMSQTDVVRVKQQSSMDQSVANEFKQSNDIFVALNGSSGAVSQPVDWFLNNMKRTITITMQQDTFTDATTIIIDAKYTIDCEYLNDGDKEIVKNLGSFSTNSTAEFARGIYVYYYPLSDVDNKTRDNFVINNKNELGVPVYLIAVYNSEADGDGQLNGFDISKYHPTLLVNELSDVVYKDRARTTVCSNIDNLLWTKTLHPSNDRTLAVKTIGNVSDQQTMYAVNIKVYNHRDDSYDDEGVFLPRDKDLLVETTGSFLDFSEKIDIDSDKTTGITNISKGAKITINQELVFDGTEKTGIIYENVNLTGPSSAINAGVYTAYAKPASGYAWADGTTATKTISWEIKRAKIVTPSGENHDYCAALVCGIKDRDVGDNQFISFSGVTHAFEAGAYTAYATPDENHIWTDGTYQTKSIKWNIYPSKVKVKWGEDTWAYDGETHFASCEVLGVFATDVGNCNAILQNDYIKNVGTKEASVVGLSNKNYELHPEAETTHTIRVNPATSATFTLNTETLVYDGSIKFAILESVGVVFEGNTTGRNAKTYSCVAKLRPGYDWSTEIKEKYGIPMNGTADDYEIPFTWTIEKRTAELRWGTTTWVYDGDTHSTTCTVGNIIDGDYVGVVLSNNNSIRNVKDDVVVSAVSLTNDNYKLPNNATVKLTITGAPYAFYETYNFDYDKQSHTGVGGQYITPISGATGTDVKIGTDKDGKRVVVPYVCRIQPSENYAWSEGTKDPNGVDISGTNVPIDVEWLINPIRDATCYSSDFSFSGNLVAGVWGEHFDYNDGGVIEATALGDYEAEVFPEQNHAWADGSVEIKLMKWSILPSTSSIPYVIGEYTYNGQAHYPEIPVFLLSPQYIMEAYNYNEGNNSVLSAVHAGTYIIKCSLVDDSGALTWSDGQTGPKFITWTINPRPIDVVFAQNEWEYDGQSHKGIATASGLYGNDVCTFEYKDNVHTNAGTYPFKVTGVSNKNYCLKSATISGSMTIKQKSVKVEWGQTTFTYDGTIRYLNPKLTNVVSGDSCTLDIVGNNGYKNAGTYPIEVRSISNANYAFPINPTTNLVINPANAIVDISSSPFKYDGKNHTISTKGVICDSNSTLTQSAIGTYHIYATPDKNHVWSDLPANQNKIKRDFVWKIEDNGVYYVGVTNDYLDADGYPVYVERYLNNTFPTTVSTGDIYVYGDYEYRYNYYYYGDCWVKNTDQNGWGVRVWDDSRTSYGTIFNSINGKPVTNLSDTFCDCSQLIAAPAIPSSVTNMDYTFSACVKLKTAPMIPSNVTSLDCTFSDCYALTTAPTIPNGVTSLFFTFSYCTSLTKAPTIPSSVIDLTYTFANCTSLTGTITINTDPRGWTACLYNTQITGINGTTTMADVIMLTKTSYE